MSREFQVSMEKMEEHLDHPGYVCGYILQSDPSEVLDSLDSALGLSPVDIGDRILRLFRGEVLEVASPSEEDVWILIDVADHQAIGRFVVSVEEGFIPSVNAEYIPVRRGRSAVKTLTGRGRDYKDSIIGQALDWTEIPAWVDGIRPLVPGYIHLRVDLVVFYNHQHNRRDCTNMIKLTEDALSTVLDVNDARNKRVTISEHLSPDDDEHIHIRIRLVNRV